MNKSLISTPPFWRLLLLLGLLYSCTPTDKDSTAMPSAPSSIPHNFSFSGFPEDALPVKGFQEVVFSVSDLEEAITFYENIAGWQLLHRSQAPDQQSTFWHLSDSLTIEQALLGNPGDDQGYLRLVQFEGTEQQQIRSSARPWDTGGIFDINLRAADLQASFTALQAAGWNGFSDPIRYQFGQFDVSEVVMQGDDGIALAMMQRYAPPLEGYPNLKVLSHVFNSTHISKDIDAAHDFFVNKLGFQVYMQTKGIDRKAGRNVLGIPQNVNDDIELPVYIVHPQGVNFGSVEFIQLKGLEGEDFGELAVPPNLGILMLRFPVKDATVYAQRLVDQGVLLHSDLQQLELAPYGSMKAFAVRSPDGVWLEFMELVENE